MTISNPTGIEAIKLNKKDEDLLASDTQNLGHVPAKDGNPKKEKKIQKKINELHSVLEKVISDQNHQYELNMVSLEELRKDRIEPNHNRDFNIAFTWPRGRFI